MALMAFMALIAQLGVMEEKEIESSQMCQSLGT